jgi:hypothetical protein
LDAAVPKDWDMIVHSGHCFSSPSKWVRVKDRSARLTVVGISIPKKRRLQDRKRAWTASELPAEQRQADDFD